jgi:hypothetical protein
MSLIRLADFLMHGVVLQSRMSGPAAAPADVSRETFLRKIAAAHFPPAAHESLILKAA